MKTILMKFQAPLQAFGTDSHFERRHSDDHPSKGVVLGLVAAAMGIRREDINRLQMLQNLKMVVRVDQAGRMIRDFQTATKYKKTGEFDRNYVTYRDYLEDAIFVVAIEGESSLMEPVYEALKKPYFQLYYGRRSCPVNYDFLIGIYEGDAVSHIEQLSWMASEWYQKRQSKNEKIRLDIYGDAACMPEERQKVLRRDVPISFSQKNGRQHDLRFESHKSIWIDNPSYISGINTEHDAFAALMEE